MKRLQEVQAEMQLIRSQLDEIEGLAEPEGEEALRSQILGERETKVDDLIARFKELQEEEGPLLKRAQDLADVRAAARDATRVEPGDGSRYLGTGPQIMRRVEPYEPQQLEAIRSGRFERGDIIARARKAIEIAPRHLDTKGREHAESLLGGGYDDEEGGNRQAPLIARHMLLTGSPEYHRQFQEYARTGYPGELLRANMSLTDSAGGFHLVAAAAA
jgi:hypothetical protein